MDRNAHSKPGDDEEMGKAGEAVRVAFTNCDAGWIVFRLEAGPQSVEVRASDILDPFPEMIEWLHLGATGAASCHWLIDEEGRATSLLLARRADGLAQLRAQRFPHEIFVKTLPMAPHQLHPDGEMYVDVIVEPLQVVEAFFNAFDTFIHSNAYRPTQWERLSLRRMLGQVLPATGIDDLTALRPADLALLANALCYPSERLWRTGETARTLTDFLDRERTCRMVPWEADGEFPTDLAGDLYVPADFAELPHDERCAFLDTFLDGYVTSRQGDDLVKLLESGMASVIRQRVANR